MLYHKKIRILFIISMKLQKNSKRILNTSLKPQKQFIKVKRINLIRKQN